MKTGEKTKELLGEFGKKIIDSTTQVTQKAVKKTVEKLDVSGDGKFDINDLIILSLKTPGCKINREEFLQKELGRVCLPNIVEKAIETSPAEAGITNQQLSEMAKHVILKESTMVTGASVALGTASSVSMGAAIPADLIQYYAYVLKVAQKMVYLYGFPEIVINKDEDIDDNVIDFFTICLGVMFDVAGARQLLKLLTESLKNEKEFVAINNIMSSPVTKKILEASWKNLKGKLIAGVVANIPFISVLYGGAVSGVVTYASFKPMCNRLRKALNSIHFGCDEDIEINNSNRNKDIIEDSPKELSKIDELREFKELLEEGILTQEEFNLKKKEILGL